jgi:hypothetical protein
MVEDDDALPDVPAGNAPAAEPKAPETPVEPQPEGDEPEGEQAEATAPEGEQPAGEVDDEPAADDDDDEPKKSRLQRYRDERDRLKAERDELRARVDRGIDPLDAGDPEEVKRALAIETIKKVGQPPNPNDPRWKDDFVGFNNARMIWELRFQQTHDQVTEKFVSNVRQQQQHFAELVSEHQERVEKFKKRAPDYDAVMAKAKLPVAQHVERLLLQSPRSEQLAYVLAKDQSRLARLNRMQPEEAAREIGRLEGRLSTPAPKQPQTQARKPITPLKGSGAAAPQGLTAVNTYIKNLYGKRA